VEATEQMTMMTDKGGFIHSFDHDDDKDDDRAEPAGLMIVMYDGKG
jgi:hypothetical protein